jgi:hypothetical protein
MTPPGVAETPSWYLRDRYTDYFDRFNIYEDLGVSSRA